MVDDNDLVKDLNKILTLEHGHLGMYENYENFGDKEIRRTFRRFMELEVEHIGRLKSIVRNLGGKPSLIIETGDIISEILGFTVSFVNRTEALKSPCPI